jgi:hypothetical protein
MKIGVLWQDKLNQHGGQAGAGRQKVSPALEYLPPEDGPAYIVECLYVERMSGALY